MAGAGNDVYRAVQFEASRPDTTVQQLQGGCGVAYRAGDSTVWFRVANDKLLAMCI
jgi:hypothetical protein